MVTTRKKEAAMPHDSAHIDGLEQLFELNRLFLISLRNELRHGDNSYGLPPGADRLVREAGAATLENLAKYPQALFELDLESLGHSGVNDPRVLRAEPLARALNLTLLVSAWNMSRRSGYAARLFLRLSTAEIHALRTTPLSDLPRLAQHEGLVSCAYREPAWLWCQLLTEARPEYRRRLLLLGLQPRVELNRDAGLRLHASI